MTKMLTIENAVNLFAESYSFIRNLTQPCDLIHHNSLQIIKDKPDQKGQIQEEIIMPVDLAPDEMIARLRAYQPAPKHLLDFFLRPGESVDALSNSLKPHGYRNTGNEPLMVIELPATITVKHPQVVQRVQTQVQANLVVKNARQKLIRPEDLPEHPSGHSPSIRLYYIAEAGKVIAWGRSTQRDPHITYVAGMSTNQAHRRRGLASAILNRMLIDDAAAGATYSVLLSSKMGYPLYRACGYQQIGTLQMFAPQ